MVSLRQLDDGSDEVEGFTDHGGQLLNVDRGGSIKNFCSDLGVDTLKLQQREDLAGIFLALLGEVSVEEGRHLGGDVGFEPQECPFSNEISSGYSASTSTFNRSLPPSCDSYGR